MTDFWTMIFYFLANATPLIYSRINSKNTSNFLYYQIIYIILYSISTKFLKWLKLYVAPSPVSGGMVDDDEEVSLALKREFGEEALNSLQASAEQKEKLENEIKQFFAHGTEIYKGEKKRLSNVPFLGFMSIAF